MQNHNIEAFDEFEFILAAEDFPDDAFKLYHVFSSYEDKIIRKLISHSPILLRGGRGSGKSTLLKEAYYRINNNTSIGEKIFPIYLSLRSLPLLKYKEQKYESHFCRLLINRIRDEIKEKLKETYYFEPEAEIEEIQKALCDLATHIQKRIILFFDDAAHIGRETSLKEFFDIFRTLSSNLVSCKAAIYPGVTEFGPRFDLLNDANVIEIARNEESNSFSEFFHNIMKIRYPKVFIKERFTTVSFEDVANFLGRSVCGNVRAFIYACNYISEQFEDDNINLPELEKTLKYLAIEYYWPLLEELKPKLGCYEPLIEPTKFIAEHIYKEVSQSMDKNEYGPSCLIHRDHVEKLKKIFELLEYTGFLVKRDASRAMKSGGRGVRYIVNLCNIMELLPNSRLTHDLFKKLLSSEKVYTEIHRGSFLDKVELPDVNEAKDLGILNMEIDTLKKSKAYPYGLTEAKILVLKENGICTVGHLGEATDEKILSLPGISEGWLRRIRSVFGQAIWM